MNQTAAKHRLVETASVMHRQPVDAGKQTLVPSASRM
jgi:hypothetical protein